MDNYKETKVVALIVIIHCINLASILLQKPYQLFRCAMIIIGRKSLSVLRAGV